MKRLVGLATILMVISLTALSLGPNNSAQAAPAGAEPEAAMAKAVSWLRTQQQADGGFGTPASSPGITAEAAMALTAAGENPNTWTREGHSPLDYLATNVISATETAGSTGKLILAVVAAEKDPHNFAGMDLIDKLNSQYDQTTGHFGPDGVGHMWAMLALEGAGQSVPSQAITWLKSVQTREGGWDWSGSPKEGGADTNDTALALQALMGAGELTRSPVITNALAFLKEQQNEDAGFPFQKPSPYGTESDADSTAYVVQGLLAVGVDLSYWSKGSTGLMDFLTGLQNPSGAFRWKAQVPDDNLLSTVHAIPALAGKTNPVVVRPAAPGVLPRTGGMPLEYLIMAGMLLILAGLGLAWSGRQARAGR